MFRRDGFYSKKAPVPDKQAAARNPMTGPALGSLVSPTVPQHPGKSRGFGTPTRVFKARSVKGAATGRLRKR